MAAKLVESLDQVSPAGDEIYVSRDGDISLGGKLFVSGKAAPNEKNASLLAFKREILTLEQATELLSQDISACEGSCEAARHALVGKEEKMVDLQSLIIKIERGIHGLEIQETSARQEIERAERHRKVVAAEIDLVSGEITELQQKRNEATENSGVAQNARQATQQTLERISGELGTARAAFETETSIVNEKRMFAATSDERRRSAQSALRRVETEENELETRLSSLRVETEESDTKIAELKASIDQISVRIASSDDDKVRESEELTAALLVLEKARSASDAISEELAATNHRAAEARNERASIEIRQAETVTRLQNVDEKCHQDLNVSLSELVSQQPADEEFELESGRSEANHLRERLENFGAINMLALEELAETEERLIFLTSQRQDIIDSIAATEEALREIKERSRERFRLAFRSHKREFHRVFPGAFRRRPRGNDAA
jgi:chromosome segregation protein